MKAGATLAGSNLRDLFPSNGWRELLKEEFDEQYFKTLDDFLGDAEAQPERSKIFRAFKEMEPHNVRVVIVGQDPYHTPGKPNGLAFSVTSEPEKRSSLRSILKEAGVDITKTTGDLGPWAKQGVLLLNSALTVQPGQPGTHSKYWAPFTDAALAKISKFFISRKLVFMLWGAHARSKRTLLGSRHLILESSHPSKYSAHKGFIGCDHFNKANEFLIKNGEEPINWQAIRKAETI